MYPIPLKCVAPAVKALTILDAAFLQLETPATPMHVGALFILDAPRKGTVPYTERLRAHLAPRLGRCEVFTRQLATLPLALANPFWTDAGTVDLRRHVRRQRLRAPVQPGDLERCVARLHSRLLPRDRPLWEFHVIEGLPAGRVGLYVKIHHAGLDGASAQGFLRAVIDESGEPSPRDAVAAPDPALTEILGAGLRHQLQELARLPATLATLAKAGASLALRPRQAGPKTPHTLLNRVIGSARSFATCQLPLARVRAAAHAHGGTVNDLVLAACAGALRAYLEQREALPAEPLVAAVPVSLRASGDEEQTIQVTFMGVNLHTDLDDRLGRFAAIHASAADSKALTESLRSAMPRDLPSLGVPWLVGAFARVAGIQAVVDQVPLPFNVLVSNVPGPPHPMAIAGRRVRSHFPVSIPYHGVALNITVQSYDGQLFFGLTGCRRALPDMDLLARGIITEFRRLARLAPGGAPARPAIVRP